MSVSRRIGVDMGQGQQSHGASEFEGIPLGNISPLKCRATLYLARRPGQRRRDVRFRLLASGLRGAEEEPDVLPFLDWSSSPKQTTGRQLTTSHTWPKRNSLNRATY